MARNRQRSSVRRRTHSTAHQVGSGVYTIAADIEGRQMPLPIYLTAPLIYVAEMLGHTFARRYELSADDLARYCFSALQDFTVALLGEFDREHFAAWIAAAKAQEERVAD